MKHHKYYASVDHLGIVCAVYLGTWIFMLIISPKNKVAKIRDILSVAKLYIAMYINQVGMDK